MKTKPQKRCPEEFELTQKLRAWASQNVPGLDIEWHTNDFRDHEFAKARTDWDATWRRWMRTSWLDPKHKKAPVARVIPKPEILTKEPPKRDFDAEKVAQLRDALNGKLKVM